MKRIVVRICAGLAAISRRHQLSRVVATAVAIVREPLMKAFSVASGSADIFVNEAERAVEAVFHGFGRRTKQTERYPFRICIKASNGATERQSLITTKTQPLRDHGSPQGQDRCTVDINGSTSAHWVQPDFITHHGLLLGKSGKSDGGDMNGGPVAIDSGLIAEQNRKSHVRRRAKS
jgi:hypothetical protein